MEAATAAPAAREDTVFDASIYDLPIPSEDGNKADRIVVTFSGSVELDRTSTDDLDFLEQLRLGRDVELSVTCLVTKKGFGYSPGKEDEAGSTGYGVGLKVHSVEVR